MPLEIVCKEMTPFGECGGERGRCMDEPCHRCCASAEANCRPAGAGFCQPCRTAEACASWGLVPVPDKPHPEYLARACTPLPKATETLPKLPA